MLYIDEPNAVTLKLVLKGRIGKITIVLISQHGETQDRWDYSFWLFLNTFLQDDSLIIVDLDFICKRFISLIYIKNSFLDYRSKKIVKIITLR